jgi:hypothetical protein
MVYAKKIFEVGPEHLAHKMFFIMDGEYIVNSYNKRLRAKMSKP